MPAPFYNAIKGTTAGAPGTGAFTPNAASAGFLAWSTVPSGWVGLVRYEDGTAWELSYSYWNGTTLSRGTNQFVSSSTGSALTLTSAATAAMVADANEIGPDFVGYPCRGWIGFPNATTAPTAIGLAAPTVTGTAASTSIAGSNSLTKQPRSSTASATTANAQAGYSGAAVQAIAAGAGFVFNCRFGVSTLPTGPRLFVGLTGTTLVANTGEPSALVANYITVGKDSTDTNLQIMVNDNAGGANKTDTGMALATNVLYDITFWQEPNSTTVFYLLVRLDTGAIFYGSTATGVPAGGSTFFFNVIGGLSATTGTAITVHMAHALIRQQT